MYRCALICLLLTTLVKIVSVSGTRWNFHSWNTANHQPVTLNFQSVLPTDEDEAAGLVCATLLQVSDKQAVGTLALSSEEFHPGLNRICRMGNLACVYTGEGLQQFSPVWKSNGTVDFYPDRGLTGLVISQFVEWSEWSLFSVLYTRDSGLDKYRETLLSSNSKILFRKIDLANKNETFLVLKRLQQANVFHFVLDLPADQLSNLLQLASSVGITSVSYSYLYIGWISQSLYHSGITGYLFAGGNFTALQVGTIHQSLPDGKEVSLAARLIQDSRRMIESAYSIVSRTGSDLGARVAPLELDLEAFQGSVCNISRQSTGLYHAALRNEINKTIGAVQLSDGRQVYNFSYDVFHLYTTKMQKFATWTADRGFVQVVGAYEKHVEHFDQYLKQVNLTVVSVEDPPFTIYREVDADGRPLAGNDRWTGFAIELFKKIASRMQLRYSIRKSFDGKFGSPIDGTNNRAWSGMIGELIRGSAHVAVASLTITYDREKVVDFTTPYMSLGLSVIMKKSKQDPDLFQFLLPFSNRVWLYMVLAWLLTAIIMYACARLSPYEWYAPSACDPVVQNQFNALNSLWFTIGSLMQQGSDLAPRATSTRMVGAVWWFFTLILISSYTANLAAFLTVTRLNDISSIADLAAQTNIKYGTLLGGSTYNFFKNSEISVYKTMWESMSSWAKTNESFMTKTSEGIDKVRRGGYAYILESTFNTYYRERDCSLMQVGSIFNPMSYAFGVNHGNVVLRDRLTEEILKLQKEQFIENLTENWLKRYNVSQPCSDQARGGQETGTLDVDAVGGVFVSLLIGLAIAAAVCFIELLVRAALGSRKQKISFQEIALNQLKLAVSCSSTNPPSGDDKLLLPPASTIVARNLAGAPLHEGSPYLLRQNAPNNDTDIVNTTVVSSKDEV